MSADVKVRARALNYGAKVALGDAPSSEPSKMPASLPYLVTPLVIFFNLSV